jgi:tetratricopeptide (TPR) repeat protein
MNKLFFLISLSLMSISPCSANVNAQSDIAPTYSQLLNEKKFKELELRANAQLETQADLAEALLAKLEMILHLDQDARLDEGIKIADQCVKAHPALSKCHELRGRILFKNAHRSNVIDAIVLYRKIKSEFHKALELDPKNSMARYHLLQLFLRNNSFIAKSITTGSEDAQNLIIETYKVTPSIATLLQANLDIYDDNLSRAQAAALAVNPKDNEEAIEIQHKILHEIAARYLQKKEISFATKLYTELVKRYPKSLVAHSNLSRILQDQGLHKEAISVLEAQLKIENNAQLWLRLGKSQAAVNDKVNALVNIEKSMLATPSLNKKEASDAQILVKQLRSNLETKIN